MRRIGGYNRIQILLVDDSLILPSLTTSIDPGSIQSNNPWSNLKVTPGSILPDLNPSIERGGQLIDTEITASFPDDDPETLNILNAYNRKKVLVRIRANSGYEKLYGTDKNALRFSFAPAGSQKSTDQTGYLITIAGKLTKFPVFLVAP